MPARPALLPPEWLDSLAGDEPEARASRRDLRVFNRLLGNEAWICRQVSAHLQANERVLELGAGEGTLATANTRCSRLAWDALDLAPKPPSLPTSVRWIQADMRDFELQPEHRIVVANLFFHHFDDASLRELGRRLGTTTRVLIVGDLERSEWRVTWFKALCAWMGASPVSFHDGVLSIRAGFRDEELPRLLGLSPACWKWTISSTLTGAYRLIAMKDS